MNTGIIYIPEQGKSEEIGSYVDENGVDVRGVELIDVISQVSKLPEGIDTLEVRIKGPGGNVDVGDAIYDYLDSLKSKYTVNTVQVGLLGSIDTKIFMVGQDRKRNPMFDFIIHNPWNNPGPGDAKYQAARLEGLLQKESALRKFYMKITGLTEEAIGPLMDAETNIDAQHSIDLKFATSLTQTPVMAKVTDKKLTFDQRVAAIRAAITGKVEDKAEVKLTLADGRELVSDAADMMSLEGSNLMLDGAPAPVGDYPLTDGSTLNVAEEGKAGKHMPKVDDKAVADPALAVKVGEIEANVGKLTELFSEFIESNKGAVVASVEKVKTEMETTIAGLRKEIGSVHTPKPASTVYALNVDKKETPFKSITERMREKEEARKKSQNKV